MGAVLLFLLSGKRGVILRLPGYKYSTTKTLSLRYTRNGVSCFAVVLEWPLYGSNVLLTSCQWNLACVV